MLKTNLELTQARQISGSLRIRGLHLFLTNFTKSQTFLSSSSRRCLSMSTRIPHQCHITNISSLCHKLCLKSQEREPAMPSARAIYCRLKNLQCFWQGQMELGGQIDLIMIWWPQMCKRSRDQHLCLWIESYARAPLPWSNSNRNRSFRPILSFTFALIDSSEKKIA